MNTTEDYWKRACEQETTIAVQAAEIERLRYLAKAMDNVAQHNGVIVDQWKARATAAEAERDALRELVKELADDLAGEIEANYPLAARQYPSEQRRYDRDMDVILRAHAALGDQP